MAWDEPRRAAIALALLVVAAAGCAGGRDADDARAAHVAGVRGAPDLARVRRVELPDSTGGAPVRALMKGLAYSMAEAARALAGGRRTEGVRAADRALRAGEVAVFATSGRAQEAASLAFEAVRRARHEVQNGDPASARRRLAEHAARLEAWLVVGGEASGPSPASAARPREPAPDGGPPGPAWALVKDGAYDGATVINARGERLGEAVGFVRAGDRVARVVVGTGLRDFLGFWDLSGERASVSAEAIVLGQPRVLGSTEVVLASSVTAAALARR